MLRLWHFGAIIMLRSLRARLPLAQKSFSHFGVSFTRLKGCVLRVLHWALLWYTSPAIKWHKKLFSHYCLLSGPLRTGNVSFAIQTWTLVCPCLLLTYSEALIKLTSLFCHLICVNCTVSMYGSVPSVTLWLLCIWICEKTSQCKHRHHRRNADTFGFPSVFRLFHPDGFAFQQLGKNSVWTFLLCPIQKIPFGCLLTNCWIYCKREYWCSLGRKEAPQNHFHCMREECCSDQSLHETQTGQKSVCDHSSTTERYTKWNTKKKCFLRFVSIFGCV